MWDSLPMFVQFGIWMWCTLRLVEVVTVLITYCANLFRVASRCDDSSRPFIP